MYKTAIVTLSDKCFAGEREDKSSPAIAKILEDAGIYEVAIQLVLPDDKALIEKTLIKLCDEDKVSLILTTGGTGLSPRDFTPEATKAIATEEVPGIAEYMRMKSFDITPKAMLSRGVSVKRNDTLIINLPGSPKGAVENLSFIMAALDHGLGIMLGKYGECGSEK